MTINATWADLEPGTVIDREVHKTILVSPRSWSIVRRRHGTQRLR
jgi:hypothetical protein